MVLHGHYIEGRGTWEIEQSCAGAAAQAQEIRQGKSGGMEHEASSGTGAESAESLVIRISLMHKASNSAT